MPLAIHLAWLQLRKEKLRLLVAILGVTFAVVLVFMQLGFQSSVYESATRYHRHLRYDLVMLNPKTPFIGFPESFSRRRLYQALALEEVASVTPVYIQQGIWKNPWEHNARSILVVGMDPARRILDLPGVERLRARLRLPDVALFDAHSRPEFGPVAARVRDSGPLVAELNDRRITVIGLFDLGTSFGVDGSLVTSDLNFRRLFPERPPGFIDLGLVHLQAGANAEYARRRLEASLERDVRILSREQFIQREVDYWASTTPVGYVFGFGAIMGLVVGCVIVYQILFADVSEHLAAYATLKAMGFSNAYLAGLVLQEALILALLGFLPGLLICFGLYAVTAEATRLPLAMTFGRAAFVLLLTLAMCGASALIALRKVRAADPAEVFA